MQEFPDKRGRVLDSLEAFGSRRAQADGRKGRLDNIRGSEVYLMSPRKLIEGNQPLPVIFQSLDRFGSQTLELSPKLFAQLFAGSLEENKGRSMEMKVIENLATFSA